MDLYPLIRPMLFALDAEAAHGLTLMALKLMPALSVAEPDPRLAIEVAGIDFPNPVGLAAGFDKNAEAFAQVLELGFGFTEVGTLTPRPQMGNPRPRLFRLSEDRAVINRMGFNNDGVEAARARLRRRRRHGIVGVNVGVNKDSEDRIADYAAAVRAMAPVASYLTVNISSPNTPDLRQLQDREWLHPLLAAVAEARGLRAPPVFLKVAPDLERHEVDDIARAAIDHGVDALIVSNTTLSRPPLLSRHKGETGGLSGAPLKQLALAKLREFRAATGGKVPLIAVGGIENGVDAYDRIKAGASLVQVYSALVYQGPGLARAINSELSRLLRRDGHRHLADAVGTEQG